MLFVDSSNRIVLILNYTEPIYIQINVIPFQAYEERVNTLVAVADELVRENYHDADRIQNGKNKIIELWNILLVLLKQRRARLEKCMRLQRVFQEMINIIDWMDEIKVFLDEFNSSNTKIMNTYIILVFSLFSFVQIKSVQGFSVHIVIKKQHFIPASKKEEEMLS